MSLRYLLSVSLLAMAIGTSLPSFASASGTFDFGKPAKAEQASRTIEIKVGDLFFEPKALEVKAGETVHFVIRNEGKLLHEFNLGSAAMHAEHQKEMQQMQDMMASGGMQHDMSKMDHDMGDMGGMAMGQGQMMHHGGGNTVMVAPGKTAELTWTFSKATNLEFACNVPGHYQAGMVGSLTVKP
ncbi:cupredoxin domain-containing protein [Pseudomonas panipatensis]|uniref:cupredoxin domain-containing protein n=1 Tax=Pseudomonas panipatensis TaxID=428992 RepID=UPI0035AEDC25